MGILNSGANVILTVKGIDDYSLKFLVEKGAMGVQRCLKSDLRKLAKATGGKLVESLATLEGEEAFEASNLGEAATVEQIRVCDDEMIMISGTKVRKGNTILIRGPNQFYLDEAHRTITDCLLAVRRVLESGRVVPGGACVETALCIYLENFATTLGSREQLAIAQFADSLLVIPKTLANNAAQLGTTWKPVCSSLLCQSASSCSLPQKQPLLFCASTIRSRSTQNRRLAAVAEVA